MSGRCIFAVLCLVALGWPGSGRAALDLGAARQEQLPNGLTVLVLEERALPVVSVQMLYRAGARNEVTGSTGIAHFLEHLAFRTSENFAERGLVSDVYAVGGEWHGYTWLDQTTYFATVPAEQLDLLLRLEADRMARLTIRTADVEVERGAVLAELHGYENDPATVLYDLVAASALLAHPYRNNTIGWESDVRALTQAELRAFYAAHYQPGNAVLAVVGDVAAAEVFGRVRELFGAFPGGPPGPLPHTQEPPQAGERRVILRGAGPSSHFQLSYPAPAVGEADYAAFLVLQALLAGSSGVNFHQVSAPVAASGGTPLAALDGGLASWFPATAQPYLFTITGTVDAGAERDLERRVERVLAGLRDSAAADERVAEARAAVLAALVFDLETTEDAAHELSFFAGLDALGTRLALPNAVAAVGAGDVLAVARRYLRPEGRTVGWYLAGPAAVPAPASAVGAATADWQAARSQPQVASEPAAEPVAVTLSSGLPVILRRVPLSPACYLRIMIPGERWAGPAGGGASPPVRGYTSLGRRCLPDAFDETVSAGRQALRETRRLRPPEPPATSLAAVNAALEQALGIDQADIGAQRAAPALVIAGGDLEPEAALASIAREFGRLEPATTAPPLRTPGSSLPATPVRRPAPAGAAQHALGYGAPALPPGEPGWLAWPLLLYVFSHDYEGRLGIEAISRRGLVYEIESRYASDGRSAWISLATGVDPEKLGAMSAVLAEQLEALRRSPPTTAELAEARRHLVGRRRSAAQSNEEITAELAREWLWLGRLGSAAELEAELAALSDEQVRSQVPAFTSGLQVIVERPH